MLLAMGVPKTVVGSWAYWFDMFISGIIEDAPICDAGVLKDLKLCNEAN